MVRFPRACCCQAGRCMSIHVHAGLANMVGLSRLAPVAHKLKHILQKNIFRALVHIECTCHVTPLT